MKKITKDWLASAESDLLLIRMILSQENLTHLSAFHAQQSIEKTFKAVVEENDLGHARDEATRESDLDFLVDLISSNGMFPRISPYIEREKVLIYEKHNQ